MKEQDLKYSQSHARGVSENCELPAPQQQKYFDQCHTTQTKTCKVRRDQNCCTNNKVLPLRSVPQNSSCTSRKTSLEYQGIEEVKSANPNMRMLLF